MATEKRSPKPVPWGIQRLGVPAAAAYAHLTFPYLQPALEGLRDGTGAWGADVEGEPAGLLLGRPAGAADWEVLSLCVTAPRRGQGVATALVRSFLRAAEDRGASGVGIGYTVQPSTPALERVLAKCGFAPPVTEATVYTLDAGVRASPWLRFDRLPPPLAVVPWRELSPGVLSQLRAGRGGAYPSYLDPFAGGSLTDPDCSLALMDRGTAAGWCVGWRLEPDAILYSSLFVREDLRAVGCAATLLAACIRRHLERGVSRGVFAVRRDNPGMERLVGRWLAPYAVRTTERRGAAWSRGPLTPRAGLEGDGA